MNSAYSRIVDTNNLMSILSPFIGHLVAAKKLATIKLTASSLPVSFAPPPHSYPKIVLWVELKYLRKLLFGKNDTTNLFDLIFDPVERIVRLMHTNNL
jgi:hypothetical protein